MMYLCVKWRDRKVNGDVFVCEVAEQESER